MTPKTEKVPWHEAIGRHLPDNSYIGTVTGNVVTGVKLSAYDMATGWREHQVGEDGLVEVLARDPD